MKIRKFYIPALLLLLGCGQETKTEVDLLISNINIVDAENAEIKASRNIGIIGDSIAYIDDSTREFNAKERIDGSGKYLIPGLWDNHVHFRGGDSLIQANKNFLKLFIANGITGVRDAGGDLTPAVLSWQSDIAKGDLTGPVIFTSGPKLDGPNPTWAGSLEVESAEEINKAIDSLESLNVDFIKIYDSRISRDAYLNILKEAKKRHITTSGHMPFTVLLEEAVENGIGSIEHLYYVLKGCSTREKEITDAVIKGEMGFWDSFEALMASYDPETAAQAFARLKENNTHVVPTLHIGRILSYLDEDDHQNDEYLGYIHPGIIKTYEGRIRRALNASPEAVERRKRLQQMFIDLVPRLHSAGVKILAGSDCGAFNSYVYPGVSLHGELEEMVKAGLTPAQALMTSTYNGAGFLGKDAQYGQTKTGKKADLLILEANPLEDIKNTRAIEYVILGGQTLDKNELEEMTSSLEKANK
ncbi:amidohydrolase family protein [Leptobacterium flavescens]|uniref:amidohydrolase family protein n=1 Tax=Leptobacterium flavescens TaxID=472055 RepID=UPI0019549C96|nr:amidohydrolase family protein [Leptobacterium flavescens]